MSTPKVEKDFAQRLRRVVEQGAFLRESVEIELARWNMADDVSSQFPTQGYNRWLKMIAEALPKEAGNPDWVKIPRELRERVEDQCKEHSLDVPFQFLVQQSLECEINSLVDSTVREHIRRAWKEAQAQPELDAQ